MYPVRFDDWYQGVPRRVEGRKVNRAGDEVGEIGEGREGSWRLIDHSFTAMFFECRCELLYSIVLPFSLRKIPNIACAGSVIPDVPCRH